METFHEITSIMAFIQVGKARSFTAAAQKLGVSKSHLSKCVRELEEKFGKPLFRRSTRYVDFTEFGKSYFDMCCDPIEEIELATRQSKDLRETPQGSLRITLAGAYGEEHISPIITKILMRNPQISAELIFSEKILDLNQDNLDIAIRVSPKKPTKGYSIQIASRKEYVCATEQFLKKYGNPETPKDLKRFNCLIGSSEQWSFTKNNKMEHIKVAGNFKSSNGRVLAKATLLGLGISKLPSVYVFNDIREGRLFPLLPDYTQKKIPIWAVLPSQKNIPPAVNLVLQELQMAFEI